MIVLTNRLNKIFQNLKDKNEKALITFSVSGYPDEETSLEICKAISDSGAHIHELNIPHEEAQADGPIIQRSSEVALRNGISINLIFEQIKEIRSKTEIPISLFSYINPIMNFGVDKFLHRCSQVGIDGVILPDLPYDEAELLCSKSRALGISPILLVAPNTSTKRI